MEESKAPKVTLLPARAARGVRRPIVSKGGPVLIEVEEVVRSAGPAARPWESDGSIDVEDLVVWAFRDQKAHRHAAHGLSAIEASAEGLVTYGRTTDGCGALADMESMGCRIDRRVGFARDVIHPAAEVVAVLVSDLVGGNMVRLMGELGGRPDGWVEPVRWFRPVVWVKHGEEGQWERTGPGNSVRVTYVMPTITREELARRRGEYTAWWQALDELAWQLSTRALGFVVRSPSAPRTPWADASEACR